MSLDYFFEFSDTVSSPILIALQRRRETSISQRENIRILLARNHPQPSIHGLAAEIYHDTQFVPLVQKKE